MPKHTRAKKKAKFCWIKTSELEVPVTTLEMSIEAPKYKNKEEITAVAMRIPTSYRLCRDGLRASTHLYRRANCPKDTHEKQLMT